MYSNGLLKTTSVSFFAISLVLTAKAKYLDANSSIEILAPTPVVNFNLQPEELKVGQDSALYIEANSSFSKNEVLVEATLDAQKLELTKTTSTLWIASLSAFSKVESHLVNAKVFIRNTKEAKLIQAAIDELNAQINQLYDDIANEPDLDIIVELQNELAKKQSYLADQVAALDALKVQINEKTFVFEVKEDPTNINFPIITDVDPNVVHKSGGQQLH